MTSNDEKAALYNAAVEADRAFQAALVAHYGIRNAGDARYLPTSKQPDHIVALIVAKQAADREYLALFSMADAVTL